MVPAMYVSAMPRYMVSMTNLFSIQRYIVRWPIPLCETEIHAVGNLRLRDVEIHCVRFPTSSEIERYMLVSATYLSEIQRDCSMTFWTENVDSGLSENEVPQCQRIFTQRF
jgi:hypothetical protein